MIFTRRSRTFSPRDKESVAVEEGRIRALNTGSCLVIPNLPITTTQRGISQIQPPSPPHLLFLRFFGGHVEPRFLLLLAARLGEPAPTGLTHGGVGIKPGTVAQGGRFGSAALFRSVAPRFAGCVMGLPFGASSQPVRGWFGSRTRPFHARFHCRQEAIWHAHANAALSRK